jgi:hypothetical protein
MGKEISSGLGIDIAGGDSYRFNAFFFAGLGDIDGILQKDNWIVVGVGYAVTTKFVGCTSDSLRGSRVSQGVDFAGLANIPILAKPTGEVAASCAKGKNGRARIEVVKWFLFNRINAESTGTAIGGQDNLPILASTHKAQSTLPFVQFAVPRAEVALNPAVIEQMPIGSGYNMCCGLHNHPPAA